MNCFAYRASIMNLGVPQMLLTTLSQFSNKEQDKLKILDLYVLCDSIGNVFSGKVGASNLKEFRKENNLSFFGGSQYFLMKRFLDNFDN